MTRILAATLLLAQGVPAAGAEPDTQVPIFVLAVGSERYLEPDAPGGRTFGNLPEVADGARRIGELFRVNGARRVRLLLSDDSKAVSRADVLAAIDATLVDATRSPTSMVVVYIAAHGVSEGLGWSHYTVPGTMTYQGSIEDLARQEAIAEHAIAAGELVDRLERAGRPFLLILDTCRTGAETTSAGVAETLGSSGTTLIDAVRQTTRELNQFRGPNPVVFSTAPGTSVPTAEDPDDSLNSIGPFARQILLWSRRAKVRSTASLLAFATSLGSDAKTTTAVTHAERATWWDAPLLAGAPAGPAAFRVPATGTVPERCCEPAPAGSRQAITGSIKVSSSPAGHWLIAGEPSSLVSPAASLTAEFTNAGGVTLEATQGDYHWSLTLAAAAGGRLSPGRQAGAQRAMLQDDGRPGLSFSTSGKSCNEVVGEFNVGRIERGPAGIAAIAGEASLSCDDVPGRVRVRFNVRTGTGTGTGR